MVGCRCKKNTPSWHRDLAPWERDWEQARECDKCQCSHHLMPLFLLVVLMMMVSNYLGGALLGSSLPTFGSTIMPRTRYPPSTLHHLYLKMPHSLSPLSLFINSVSLSLPVPLIRPLLVVYLLYIIFTCTIIYLSRYATYLHLPTPSPIFAFFFLFVCLFQSGRIKEWVEMTKGGKWLGKKNKKKHVVFFRLGS